VTVLVGLAGVSTLPTPAEASQAGATDRPASPDAATLTDALLSFYNGRYVEAAAQALTVRATRPDDLAVYELRASALLFQLKHALANRSRPDKRAALKQCDLCAEWMAAFLSDTARGQALARATLAIDSSDGHALFFLAKLDLNFVWLQLDVLGRKKGWHEYWEARRSLDALLERSPQHVRGRVARAWIDYVVDTRVPRGTRWLMGGGSRTRGLLAARQAASTEADFFVKTEAAFALWEMEVRERHFPEAVEVARGLLRDFPDNGDLTRFLNAHDPALQTPASGTAKQWPR
jgi:hypothetical protein